MIRFSKVKRIHFVGIGGAGMSGIAEVLKNMGFSVTGSDIAESSVINNLRDKGIKITIGHKPQNIGLAETLVFSSAITRNNPEIKEALKNKIPVIPRAEMLAELMRVKYSISIAGTHGKTTTTSMLATILSMAGKDPTYVVGGKLMMQESGAKLGKSNYLVAEADESDGSFLSLFPTIAIITNIEDDHLDYYKNINNLKKAFKNFGNKVPFYGLVVMNSDCNVSGKIIKKLNKRVRLFGLSEKADIRAKNIKTSLRNSEYDLMIDGKQAGKVKMKIPGLHNIMNSLAAVAASIEAGIEPDIIINGLKNFSLPERRLQTLLDRGGVFVADDYAHHPTEIKSTLSVFEGSEYKRVIAVFQPHRFTRLQIFMGEFGKSFGAADLVIIAKLYGANQKEIKNVNSGTLVKMMKKDSNKNVVYIEDFEEIKSFLLREVKSGDAIVFLSAGNLTKTAHEFADQLGEKIK